MAKWIYAVSAAAVALAAPAVSKPDEGKGGNGKGQSAQSRGGHDGHKARGNDGAKHDMRAAKSQGPKSDRDVRVKVKGRDGDDRRVIRSDRRDDDRRIAGARFDDDFDNRGRGGGLIDGCPPGLAKKNNGCLPPGIAKKVVGSQLSSAFARSALTGPYANWYRDDDRYMYRMGDYGIYRVDRSTNLVNALIPSLLGNYGYMPVGQRYPADYNFYNVPTQYQSYYPDGGDYAYRYGNGAIYSVNPQTSMIQSIVALLAGDLAVGQRLPQSYGAYNVPLAYRDQYADNANSLYRYNDGYIYQADPKTQLITAIISAIV